MLDIHNAPDSQLVKAYTNLMMTCELELSMLMAQVPISKDISDYITIATAIRDWCLFGVKPLEGDVSVEENVGNQLTITNVGSRDTVEGLVIAFHKAIKWNTPAR
ncbi:hypothetical protein [Microcoleus phage My-WqHQDG]|nr:hypothetical protein [Microcoleus phage My-WqHQDG]